jgi:hypothetical protein
VQPGLRAGADLGAEVAQDVEEASLGTKARVDEVGEVEARAIVEGEADHEAAVRLRSRPHRGRDLGERGDARAGRLHRAQVAGERHVVVGGVLRARDVVRVIGEDERLHRSRW